MKFTINDSFDLAVVDDEIVVLPPLTISFTFRADAREETRVQRQRFYDGMPMRARVEDHEDGSWTVTLVEEVRP